MKVNGSDPLSRLREMLDKMDEAERGSRTQARKGPESESSASGVASTDSVQVSKQAQDIRRLREAIETSPDVRSELVEQLRQEISSGQYRIDGTKIAHAMLEDEQVS